MKFKFVFLAVAAMLLIFSSFTTASVFTGERGTGEGGSGSGQPPMICEGGCNSRPNPLQARNIKYGIVELVWRQGPVLTYRLVEKDYEAGTTTVLGFVHARGAYRLPTAVKLYTEARGYNFVWSYKDIAATGHFTRTW